MKVIVLASIAALAIATLAAFLLETRFQTTTAGAFTTSGARLDAAGDTLVE